MIQVSMMMTNGENIAVKCHVEFILSGLLHKEEGPRTN